MIKTSSSVKSIYANRSYAKSSVDGKKVKDGYYLAINFDKYEPNSPKEPAIRLIRFGYLHHEDWTAQASETGQQSRLSPSAYKNKLLTIYSLSDET